MHHPFACICACRPVLTARRLATTIRSRSVPLFLHVQMLFAHDLASCALQTVHAKTKEGNTTGVFERHGHAALPRTSWRRMALAAIKAGTKLRGKRGVGRAWIKGCIAAAFFATHPCAMDDEEDFFTYSAEGLVTGQDALDFPHYVHPWVASTCEWRDVWFTQIYRTMPKELRNTRAEGNASRQLASAIRAEVKAGRVQRVGKGDVYRACR